MSIIAWYGLDKNTILRLHDYCSDPNCICQKEINITPKQFQLEGNGFKNTMKKNFDESEATSNKFLKPAVNVAAPFVGMAVSAKTKTPKVGQAATNILKPVSGGKLLSLTDMHGKGLRSKIL